MEERKTINFREEAMMMELRKKNKPKELKNITRLEVIDENGRAYTRWDCKVEESVQDDGRTLKLFVGEKE